MELFSRTTSFSTCSVLFITFTLLAVFECGFARSIFDGDREAAVYLRSPSAAFSSHNRPASSGVIRGLQPYFDENALRPTPAKRRLVVRLPFAQNPDTMQLSRIYKGLFSQQKRFLIPMKNWDE